ncbi:hypothetical protein L9F63_028175, partial [Diploptera punctata]
IGRLNAFDILRDCCCCRPAGAWQITKVHAPSWKNVHHLETLLRSIQSSPYTPRMSLWTTYQRSLKMYEGSVHLASLLRESSIHQLALKIEPRGTLYLRLRHTDPHTTFQRQGIKGHHVLALFGADLETIVTRESLTGGVPGGEMCVEEIERRGLDIIGLYRLCGSATKKRILREAFERNARTVDLSPDNVPDINVITGVLKDYLRELPEPLFTKCLYQMMVDALSVCLPDDPEGNAKLMFSILDCLPKVNRHTLIFLMDHLALVVSQSERNKMSPQNLAICFGPVLMLQSEEGKELDFLQPISVLKYLLEIWPTKSEPIFQASLSLTTHSPFINFQSSQGPFQLHPSIITGMSIKRRGENTAFSHSTLIKDLGPHANTLVSTLITSNYCRRFRNIGKKLPRILSDKTTSVIF